MFTQLDPQIPLQTEKGPGQAVAVIDYSEEHDLVWVVILDESGEIWCVPNPKVRGFPNWTQGRAKFPNPFQNKGLTQDVKPGRVYPCFTERLKSLFWPSSLP